MGQVKAHKTPAAIVHGESARDERGRAPAPPSRDLIIDRGRPLPGPAGRLIAACYNRYPTTLASRASAAGGVRSVTGVLLTRHGGTERSVPVRLMGGCRLRVVRSVMDGGEVKQPAPCLRWRVMPVALDAGSASVTAVTSSLRIVPDQRVGLKIRFCGEPIRFRVQTTVRRLTTRDRDETRGAATAGANAPTIGEPGDAACLVTLWESRKRHISVRRDWLRACRVMFSVGFRRRYYEEMDYSDCLARLPLSFSSGHRSSEWEPCHTTSGLRMDGELSKFAARAASKPSAAPLALPQRRRPPQRRTAHGREASSMSHEDAARRNRHYSTVNYHNTFPGVLSPRSIISP
ncbi:hypothetical protein EVAR_60565_1 [Eumeta japonica]|uniref:Uncharacterized protein n=1 Tax=Eumeta variegata TaxID=151549 RepID=A0A4C1YJA2_EUMVA|nr:hypothetical protein EVAR_60565_1 [Eumeta japonica]